MGWKFVDASIIDYAATDQTWPIKLGRILIDICDLHMHDNHSYECADR